MPNAIVIQGNVTTSRTLDIVKYCIDKNPNSIIILSTWQTCNTSEFDCVKSSRFYLITSELPPGSGNNNRHLQRISTYIGVVKAQSLGATHVLKMRSDQLLRRLDICEHLLLILVDYGQERLVVGHGGTTFEERWGKFHVTDFWMFGKIHHFLSWYDPAGIDTTAPFFRPDFTGQSPEPDFVQLWLIRNNLQYSDFRDLLAERFIVLDCETVDMVFKTMPLDVSEETVRQYWRSYGDPLTVRHDQWLGLLKK